MTLGHLTSVSQMPFCFAFYIILPIILRYGNMAMIGGAGVAKTKYYINLTTEERDLLMRIVCEAKESERTIMRARILLMSEAAQAEKTSIKKLADTLGTTDTTIQTVRTEYAKEGLEAALYRKKRNYTPYKKRINDDVIRQIKELAASPPPEGRKRWSTRLLCVEAEKRGIVEHIVSSTMSRVLKGE